MDRSWHFYNVYNKNKKTFHSEFARTLLELNSTYSLYMKSFYKKIRLYGQYNPAVEK